MSNVKPHFECSGYGCNDCTKGVIIEDLKIEDTKPIGEKVIDIRLDMTEIESMLLKLIDEKIKSCPIVTHGARKGYFVEIEE